MTEQANHFQPGPNERTVLNAAGKAVEVPAGWSLLPPGDAAATRRVKAAGLHWIVQQKRGRRTFSKGVWAPTTTIERVLSELKVERSTDAYARRQQADRQRREKKQAVYVEDFYAAVLEYLGFHSDHDALAKRLARAVTKHATPVGSGTVARTERIPVRQRAEAAVIAWMRHQTTAYDDMKIARVKGRRREVRRQLAQRSKELLQHYRQSSDGQRNCPLRAALER